MPNVAQQAVSSQGSLQANSSLEDLEIYLLLEGIHRRWGMDFRDYSLPSLRRRVWRAVHAERLQTVSALQDRVLHDEAAWRRLLRYLSVHVTRFYRDPEFYKAFRERVVPVLREQPSLRFWHIGCSSGEEVYSMAILLHEEGLYERSRIYATDIHEPALIKGRQGIYSLELLSAYEANYTAAGGTAKLSDYYNGRYERGIMRSFLKEHVVFAPHNLTADGCFTLFDVIFCRNVLIYFNRQLQSRVHELINSSLLPHGYLGLGNRENLRHTVLQDQYELMTPDLEGVHLYHRARSQHHE